MGAAVLEAEQRHRLLLLAGVELRAGRISLKYSRRHPYPEQKYRHGWIPTIFKIAARYHGDDNDDEDLDKLIDAVYSGEKKRTPFGSGLNSTTHIVDHNNGDETVEKKLADVAGTFGYGLTPEQQGDAEQLASRLGRAIDAPVPTVLRTGPDTINMDVVYGDRWTDIEDEALATGKPEDKAVLAAVKDKLLTSREGIRLGVLDLLSENWDRANGGNWMVDDDFHTPVGVDHAFAWSEVLGVIDPSDPPPSSGISPFSEIFVSPIAPDARRWSPNGHPPLSWVDNPLTQEDVEFLREQLASVEDDFIRLGRHDWWEFASARLEAIAAHATGEDPIFT